LWALERDRLSLLNFRDGEKHERQEDLVPLLLSINCIAAGLGWTA